MHEPVPGDDRWRLRVLDAADVDELQRFFDANPEYFLTVTGEPPRADEAARELADVPPAGMPYREMLLIGFVDAASGVLVGMATIVGDFIAANVWHIGLFIVASALHGNGTAPALYRMLERWMVERGAAWIRLGVVAGNAKAERFWQRSGYVQVRERGPMQMGLKTNLLRVMVKSLAGGSIERYLALVERDRVGAA
ncbi:MAG TPA: GNAT family N-acetyltransferase [Caldimonas sp.]|jgi:GNAT superfamily N-acetyltransferase